MYYRNRQYDISDTRNPKLTGQVWLGGSITKEFGVKVLEDPELLGRSGQPQARYIQGKNYNYIQIACVEVKVVKYDILFYNI